MPDGAKCEQRSLLEQDIKAQPSTARTAQKEGREGYFKLRPRELVLAILIEKSENVQTGETEGVGIGEGLVGRWVTHTRSATDQILNCPIKGLILQDGKLHAVISWQEGGQQLSKSFPVDTDLLTNIKGTERDMVIQKMEQELTQKREIILQDIRSIYPETEQVVSLLKTLTEYFNYVEAFLEAMKENAEVAQLMLDTYNQRETEALSHLRALTPDWAGVDAKTFQKALKNLQNFTEFTQGIRTLTGA